MNAHNNANLILPALQVLFEPAQVVELRIITSSSTSSGYFDDMALLAVEAAKWDNRDDVMGVYVTLNPVLPELLHRSKNKMRARMGKKDSSTSDKEILERRLLLIDVDGANRPAGISATDMEVEAAKEKAYKIAQFLKGRGFHNPLTAMSGNGFHLLYKIQMPNDAESVEIVKKCLNALAYVFDDNETKVDTCVFNAARITKLYGTVARKGDNTPERPHRRAAILGYWGESDNSVTPTECLKGLASLVPEEPKRKPGRPSKEQKTIDVHEWVESKLPGIGIHKIKSWHDATVFELSECPFDSSHRAPDSCIIQHSSGAVSFKCLHDSCRDNDWHTLRARFDPKEEKSRRKTKEEIKEDVKQISFEVDRPVIDVSEIQLEEAVNNVVESFRISGKDDPFLFVRGGRLVRILNEKIEVVTPQSAPIMMSQAAHYVRMQGNTLVDAWPPRELANALVNKGDWQLPILDKVSEVPVLRADGTILDKPGYDAVSRVYYRPFGTVPLINHLPERENALQAAKYISEMISEFPFDNQASHDNMMGAFVTIVIREVCGLVPLLLIDAPVSGTGKSLISKLPGIIATGKEVPVTSLPKEGEEMRKKITSCLLDGKSLVIFDNIERTLYDDVLAAVLTAEVWEDRLLGRNQTLILPNRTIWFATGNNVILGGDIPRRTVAIRLNANMRRPWQRGKFKFRLPDWAFANRGKLLTALLAMVRAWVLDGHPSWSGQPVGTFEKWCRMVGGVLEYCGFKEFLGNLEEVYESSSSDDPLNGMHLSELFFLTTIIHHS